MVTTAIIVEVMIIGFFAAIWVFLLLLRLGTFDFNSVRHLASQSGTWSVFLVFISAGLFYQLGTIVNALSLNITEVYRKKRFSDPAVPGINNELVRAMVFQNGADDLVADLKLYLSFVRLSRAGIINFSLIAISLFTFGGRFLIVGVLSLVLAFACVFTWLSIYGTYYKRMAYAYNVIESSLAAAAKQ